jgi:hypothetical protein
VAALGLVLGGMGNSPELALSGVATYALGGPIVHAAHGRWGTAGASLVLRVGLPTGLALLGANLNSCDRRTDPEGLCPAVSAGLGFVVGAVAAIALDAGLLAYDDVPPLKTNRARSPALPSLTPLVAVDSKRTVLGLVGTF